MYTTLDEVIPVLRGRLKDYLSLKLGVDLSNAQGNTRFFCFAHEDHNTPGMGFVPKSNLEAVHCFSCNWSGSIFNAAYELEGLPTHGPGFVHETIPAICRDLEIQIQLGEPSPTDLEKMRLYRLAHDISDVLEQAGDPTGYVARRNWEQPDLIIGSIAEESLIQKLSSRGWDLSEVSRSLMIRTSSQSFFGPDKVTFAMKDERGRVCGFMARNLTDKGPKYINTPETLIYSKGKVLVGIDSGLQEARRNGLYIVEGLGDLAQLKRLGIKNSAATCGTALTEPHLLMLKQLGINRIQLCLDWDDAGNVATNRIFFDILSRVKGVAASVVLRPDGEVKDIDELLKSEQSPERFNELESIPAFEWALARLSDNDTPDAVCEKMVPLIAAEPAAVRRELMMKKLSSYTELSYTSILSDVNSILNRKYEERKEKLLGAAEQYRNEVESEPENIMAIMSQHEQRVQRIEKEYNRESIGVNYQLNRWDAIQQMRQAAQEGSTGFKMGWFRQFEYAMSGGMPWSTGCLIQVGGRANSGKTATCIMIGTDISFNDEDATTIFHFTDDSYEQTEPRIKSNIARMLYPEFPRLSVGMIVNPKTALVGYSSEYWKALDDSNEAFKELIAKERLVILDAEDGSSMSTLEKNVRYYRTRYPSRKLMLVCDNTHNYNDFYNLDQTQRITQISNLQKSMVTRYHACMIATAEYRKNAPRDISKMVLPVDDDLADARALMFRPNVIFHVYNDVHDRKEHAEIFWKDIDGKVNPRLMLHFTKNKISSFKDKLILDLDPKSVTLIPKDEKEAEQETYRFHRAKEEGSARIEGQKVVWIDATEYDDDKGNKQEVQSLYQ